MDPGKLKKAAMLEDEMIDWLCLERLGLYFNRFGLDSQGRNKGLARSSCLYM